MFDVSQNELPLKSLYNAKRITCPGDAVCLVQRIFDKENCKTIVAIYLKEKNEVVDIHLENAATLEITQMDFCKVLAKAVMIKATSIILVHSNHGNVKVIFKKNYD